MKQIKSVLSDYKSRFQSLREEIELKKNELQQSKISSSIMKDALSWFISDSIPVVTKTDSRKFLDQFGTQHQDHFGSLRREFNSLYNNLENDLSSFIITNKEGIKEKRKTTSYILSVKNVKRLDTKVKHVLNGLDELTEIEDKIVLKDDYSVKKQEVIKQIHTDAQLLWKMIETNDLLSFQNLDETEYYDRKEKFISNEDGRVEDLIVALANKEGGIIVYGLTEDKKLNPLNNKHRNTIQNQITSLCCDKILEPIQPKFHPIITSQSEDKGLLCVLIPRYTKHHHCTSSGKCLWRVGSNNKPIPPNKRK